MYLSGVLILWTMFMRIRKISITFDDIIAAIIATKKIQAIIK